MVASATPEDEPMKPSNLEQLQEVLSMVNTLGSQELNAFTKWVDGELDEPDREGEMLLEWARTLPHI